MTNIVIRKTGLVKNDQAIIHLTDAVRLLAKVQTIQDAQKIIGLAEAARIYAQQAQLGMEAQNYGSEIKLRAQRKAGQILKQAQMSKGGRPPKTPTTPSRGFSDTLQDKGISCNQSSSWQQIASLPQEVFEQHIEKTRAAGRELTSAGVLRLAKTLRPKDIIPLPNDKYRVIYADPPWKYGNEGHEQYGPAERHYPTMTIPDLCALDVQSIAADNAVLFMWVTSPLLSECWPIIKAWGFQYKASFVWDKIKHNYGHYNSVRHEFLLVCTRGSCTPDNDKLFDSVVSIERSGKHSEKPEQFREIIQALYPHGKRIELFARAKTDGWSIYGNEI